MWMTFLKSHMVVSHIFRVTFKKKFHLIGPMKLSKDEFEQYKLVSFKLNFHYL